MRKNDSVKRFHDGFLLSKVENSLTLINSVCHIRPFQSFSDRHTRGSNHAALVLLRPLGDFLRFIGSTKQEMLETTAKNALYASNKKTTVPKL